MTKQKQMYWCFIDSRAVKDYEVIFIKGPEKPRPIIPTVPNHKCIWAQLGLELRAHFK